ncbi:glycosyltransferase [Haloferax sp. Atlit-12N]|uniref:glycosyltransferase family 4 protein n=1 Tax=Haloferax sp. Atlit-12N TaxID=2077203 RepID=UPI000E24FAA4|nr:glycosyltransferase family 4 protein [Haloferax sp. Atlit-12N]RDZ63869.1 glycosyltransferase [Haloferax sp. Atlit-12N]
MADICLVNGVFPPDEFGGAENYVHRVAVALQERGHDVLILTTTSERSRESLTPIKDSYKGVPVYRFYPLNHSHRSDSTGENVLAKALWHQLDTVNPHAKRVVSKFLEKHQPDVVHTNNFMGITASAGKAISESDARYVHTLHDYSLICPKSNLLRDRTAPEGELRVCEDPPTPCLLYAGVKRKMIGEPDIVIGPSQHVVDVHREHGFFTGIESACIPHGIEEVADEPGDESLGPSVLYAGKHLRAKGLETLFDAARNLPEVTFHLCGTGPFDDRSEEVASTLSNVEYHGFVSDERLRELRRSVSAAVVPSIWMENSPLVIYESFAEGLPVIGADVGGIPELVDETRGRLFSSGDADELVSQIREITGEETILLRQNTLSWAGKHSLQKHINSIENHYEV